MEDLYVLYVIGAGVNHNYFWHEPIANVERMYHSAVAFKSWESRPVMK